MSGRKIGGGITGGPNCALTSVSPETCASVGGDEIVLIGEGFDPRDYDDYFTTVPLDPAKWNDTTVGTGNYTTGPGHLFLSSGAVAAGSVDIDSVNTFSESQAEIRVNVPSFAAIPASDVEPIKLYAIVDANNFAIFYIVYDANGDYTLNAEVVRGGATVESYSDTFSYGTYDLKILRDSNVVCFYYNDSLFYKSEKFDAGNITYRISVDNLLANFEATSTVEWFYFRSYVKMNNQYLHNPVVVSDTRMRSIVPASLDENGNSGGFAGDVDVTAVGKGGDDTLADALTYTYQKELRLIDSSQQSSKLDFVDYNQIKTPENKDKGI